MQRTSKEPFHLIGKRNRANENFENVESETHKTAIDTEKSDELRKDDMDESATKSGEENTTETNMQSKQEVTGAIGVKDRLKLYAEECRKKKELENTSGVPGSMWTQEKSSPCVANHQDMDPMSLV